MPVASCDRLLDCVRTDFPALAIRSAWVGESGWDNDVIIINDEYVFRFPKDDGVRLDVEIAVLNHLRGRITMPIPRIEFVGRSTPFVGYRKIHGTPLTTDACARLTRGVLNAIASDLARFLFEVHRAIPIELAETMGVVNDDPQGYLREARTLRGRLEDAATADFVESIISEAEETLAIQGPRSFLYNDLHGDNMAFDAHASRLNGIFDFGDIAIGDVHREFSPLHLLDPALLEATVASYRRSTGVQLSLRRMVLLQRLDRLSDLAETIDQPGNIEPEKVLRELRHWMNDPDIYTNLP